MTANLFKFELKPRELAEITKPCEDCWSWDRTRNEIEFGGRAGNRYFCRGNRSVVIEECPVKPMVPQCGVIVMKENLEISEVELQ